MIERNEFLEGIGKIANLTNSEPPGNVAAYYDKFKYWNKPEWVAACDSCATELNKFPSVSEIYSRRPKNYSTGAVEQSKGWLTDLEEAPEERGPQELEDEIDKLSVQQAKWLFEYGGAVNGSQQLADWFMKNKNHALWRFFIRESLKDFRQNPTTQT